MNNQDSEETMNPTTPSHSEPTECHDTYLLFDDEDWLVFMEPAFCENPDAAECFAHLLFRFRQALERAPEDIARVIFSLDDGIRLAYKFTNAYRTALKHYKLYLGGYLKAADEPMQLITAAIERGQLQATSEANERNSAKGKRSVKDRKPRRKQR